MTRKTDNRRVAQQRLESQLVTSSHQSRPVDVIRHMCAMQAQNYPMAKWAVGVRMKNATDRQIEKALDIGAILRTHLLRPTWHLVCPEDIQWMTELSAPRIRTAMGSRHRQLGITPSLAKKTNDLIARQIMDHGHQTRRELTVTFEKKRLPTGDNRMAHYLMLAELDGLICSGKAKGKQQTYALLTERLPKSRLMDRDEALGELAKRYFTSRSPATLADFAWWSGLTKTDAQRAIDIADIALEDTEVEGQFYFSTPKDSPRKTVKAAFLLPAYDEFIIGYTDRSACLDPVHQNKVISRNGMFWPVIVRDGRVLGLWKRAEKSSHMAIEIEYFGRASGDLRQQVEKAAEMLGRFHEKPVEIL